MKKLLIATSAFGIWVAALTIPAKADIVLSTGASGTGNNVLFSSVSGAGSSTLTTITNQGVGVTFTSDRDLTATASGQAQIEASSGLLNNNDYVEWYLTNGTGTTEDIFSVNVPNSSGNNGDKNAATDITVYVNGSSTALGTDAIPSNGFFTVSATGSDVIDSIKIVFNGDVSDVEHFRITSMTSSVPEPSTWAMMILGFCGLGFMAYRKKGTLRLA